MTLDAIIQTYELCLVNNCYFESLAGTQLDECEAESVFHLWRCVVDFVWSYSLFYTT